MEILLDSIQPGMMELPGGVPIRKDLYSFSSDKLGNAIINALNIRVLEVNVTNNNLRIKISDAPNIIKSENKKSNSLDLLRLFFSRVIDKPNILEHLRIFVFDSALKYRLMITVDESYSALIIGPDSFELKGKLSAYEMAEL